MLRPVLVAIAVLTLVQARAQTNPAQNAQKDCELSWTGQYRNNWGFEAQIPPGRKGYSNSPHAGCGDEMTVIGDHGVLIPLSKEPYEPDRHIELDAGYNTLELGSVSEETHENLNSIFERAVKGSVRVLRRSQMSVDGIRGERILVRYRDRKLERDFLEDALSFLRRQGDKGGPSIEYSVYLRTPAEHYAEDRQEFERLLTTFHFVPPNDK
jgi:hypothetical protein